MSLKPSPRRHRSDSANGFQPVAVGASHIDPLLGGISSQDRASTNIELERNTPVLSQVLFQWEDSIEVKELSKSVAAPNSPLAPNHPEVLLYVGTRTHRPSSPGLHISIPLMTTAGSMASTTSVASMQTPISVQGGGTISIPSNTPSMTIFGSTSIPSISGNSHATASNFGFFPFGMSSQGIPSDPLNIPSIASTSMMSGLDSFQGFPFGSVHIPHSNPTVGSMHFPFTSQGSNPFQSWTNLVVSGIRVGNQFFGQQGNVSYSLVNYFKVFNPLLTHGTLIRGCQPLSLLR